MEYKSIRQTLAMSSSTAKPKDAAEEEYQKRLNGYSTYRSGIEFEGHEMFAVAKIPQRWNYRKRCMTYVIFTIR